MTLRTELYGLLNPLKAAYGLIWNTKGLYSPIKMYLSALVSIPSSKADKFPSWKLEDLLTYLESSRFEPLEENSLETCRVKALILMMLATGRRLEDIQALKSWRWCKANASTRFLKFKHYEGWKGKAVSIDSPWRPQDVSIYAIDNIDGKDLSTLCPLRAFRLFWTKRLALGSSRRLWVSLF